MEFSVLQSIVAAQFKPEVKTFQFNPQPFNSTEINDLLTKIVRQTTWEVTGIQGLQEDQAKKTITLFGTCSKFFNQANAELTMIFFLDGAAKPQLMIKLNLGNNWSFTNTFKQLEQTVFADVSFNDPPFYVFASANYQDDTLENGTFVAGMNFYGSIIPGNGAFVYVRDILGQFGNTTAVGQISIEDGTPNMTLTLGFQNTLEKYFSILKNNVEIQLISQFSKDLGDMTGLKVGTNFALGSHSQLEISTVLNPWILDNLFFVGKFDNVKLPSLSGFAKELGDLISENDLVSSLPSSNDDDRHLELQMIGLGLNTKIWKPSVVSLRLGTPADNRGWKIPIAGNKSLILEDLQINLEKYIEEHDRGILVIINCLFNIANLNVFLEATNANTSSLGWTFEGNTEPKQAIPIGTLIKDIVTLFGDVSLPSAIEELTIQNLGISFNTKTKNFTFTCEGELPIDSKQIYITVNINIIQQQDGSYKKHFDGHITIGSLKFALIFDTDQTSTKFLAAYHDDQTIKIKDLIGYIDSQLKEDIPEGLEISLKDALFAYAKQQTLTNFLFGLNIDGGINLSNLPLVGQEFPPNQTLKISLQILATKADFTAPELQALNTLYTDGGIKLPTTDINQRLDLIPSLQFGSEIQQLELPITINKQTGQIEGTTPPRDNNLSPPVVTPSSTPTPISDSTKWFTLQKSLGPVHFQRIGLKYQDSKIWVLLDASLNLAGLSLSLDGLAVNSPLNQFDPKFDLKGIGIDYKGSDTLEIGGAFLRTTRNGIDEYNGAAVIKFNVKAKTLNLSAIGSYAYFQGHPSLFIYAILDYPIGGPSFFFVTGLAAGFGYNRALKVPTIDQVATFPLVAEAVNPPPAEGSNSDQAARLTGELTKLRDYIPPETGQIFLAIGIKFTSFKLIDSFLLLTVAFGNRFELNLLGLATLIAPPNVGAGVPPVAEVQLALKASFLPAEGFIGVIAQLTPNSYILSQACHLTGGFAFYGWFAPNVHEGDFVLTLGGYHPLFKVPDHYPKVPRLGLNWQVSSELYIKADAYFALTPSAIMAGGHLQATWNSGPLSAWFNAGADFLMSWKPYHYDISIYIDMGVSYTFQFFGTQHITVQLGADLHIWGPEFTGIAHIHLWIISFDVSFGSSASQAPTAIDWNEFKTSFLPAADAICTIAVKEGLVRKVNQDDKTDLGNINPKDFCLVTNSVIPIKTCNVNLNTQEINTQFGIGSMAVTASELISELTITINKNGTTLNSTEFDEDFACTPLFKKVPIALWGESLTPSLNGNQFIENTLSGLEIKPKKQPELGATQAINRSKLQFSTTSINNAYHWRTISTFQEETTKDISSTIVDNAVKNSRENLLKALNLNSEEIDLSATIADNLLGSPKIGVLVN